MELTKKYRILYRDNQLIMPLDEFPEDSITYVGDDVQSFETDDLAEAEKFIEENNLHPINYDLENEDEKIKN